MKPASRARRLGHRCLDHARRDGVDANAVARKITGKCLGQELHAADRDAENSTGGWRASRRRRHAGNERNREYKHRDGPGTRGLTIGKRFARALFQNYDRHQKYFDRYRCYYGIAMAKSIGGGVAGKSLLECARISSIILIG